MDVNVVQAVQYVLGERIHSEYANFLSTIRNNLGSNK